MRDLSVIVGGGLIFCLTFFFGGAAKYYDPPWSMTVRRIFLWFVGCSEVHERHFPSEGSGQVVRYYSQLADLSSRAFTVHRLSFPRVFLRRCYILKAKRSESEIQRNLT